MDLANCLWSMFRPSSNIATNNPFVSLNSLDFDTIYVYTDGILFIEEYLIMVLENNNYVTLSKESAIADLLNAVEALGSFPTPPDHLVLLEQIVRPESLGEITDDMKDSYQRRTRATRHALGSGIIMQCKGSQCYYSNECELKQSGVPDSVLMQSPCILEIGLAQQIFNSLALDLFKENEEIAISGVEALNIMEVIRKKILAARLDKCIKLKGEMYEEIVGFADGMPITQHVINPAIAMQENISRSIEKNVQQLALDRNTRIKHGIMSSSVESLKRLQESAQRTEVVTSPPMIAMKKEEG